MDGFHTSGQTVMKIDSTSNAEITVGDSNVNQEKVRIEDDCVTLMDRRCSLEGKVTAGKLNTIVSLDDNLLAN